MKFDNEGNLVLGCHNYLIEHPKWWQDEIDEGITEKLNQIKKLNFLFVF